MNSLAKVVGTIAMVLLAAIGLGMSLCGGGFTFVDLTGSGISGVLPISIPALVIGLALLRFAVKRLLAARLSARAR